MGTALLLGTTNDTWTGGGGGQVNVHIDKWTALATGKVTEIRIKVSAAGTVKIAIYADSAGEPGALLSALNTGQSVSVGWNTITLSTEVNVVSGTAYWIGFYGSVTTGMFYYQSTPGVDRTNRYKASTYSTWSWPDPAGSGWTTQNDYEYSK